MSLVNAIDLVREADVKRCYIEAILGYMAEHDPPGSLDVLGIPAAVQEAMTGLIVRKLGLSRM